MHVESVPRLFHDPSERVEALEHVRIVEKLLRIVVVEGEPEAREPVVLKALQGRATDAFAPRHVALHDSPEGVEPLRDERAVGILERAEMAVAVALVDLGGTVGLDPPRHVAGRIPHEACFATVSVRPGVEASEAIVPVGLDDEPVDRVRVGHIDRSSAGAAPPELVGALDQTAEVVVAVPAAVPVRVESVLEVIAHQLERWCQLRVGRRIDGRPDRVGDEDPIARGVVPYAPRPPRGIDQQRHSVERIEDAHDLPDLAQPPFLVVVGIVRAGGANRIRRERRAHLLYAVAVPVADVRRDAGRLDSLSQSTRAVVPETLLLKRSCVTHDSSLAVVPVAAHDHARSCPAELATAHLVDAAEGVVSPRRPLEQDAARTTRAARAAEERLERLSPLEIPLVDPGSAERIDLGDQSLEAIITKLTALVPPVSVGVGRVDEQNRLTVRASMNGEHRRVRCARAERVLDHQTALVVEPTLLDDPTRPDDIVSFPVDRVDPPAQMTRRVVTKLGHRPALLSALPAEPVAVRGDARALGAREPLEVDDVGNDLRVDAVPGEHRSKVA